MILSNFKSLNKLDIPTECIVREADMFAEVTAVSFATRFKLGKLD